MKAIYQQIKVILFGFGSYPTALINIKHWDYTMTKNGVKYNNLTTLKNHLAENKLGILKY